MAVDIGKLRPTERRLFEALRSGAPRTEVELFSLLPVAPHDDEERTPAEMDKCLSPHLVGLRRVLKEGGYEVLARRDRVVGMMYRLVQFTSLED